MIFLLDNHDSFTYNLYQYLGELGETVIVKRQDACTLEDIEKYDPDLIVISPGPCTPNETPFSLAVIKHFAGHIPILGVCLGHQAIGQFFGGTVIRAQRPIHGKTAHIRHRQEGIFEHLNNPLGVTRYHSLVLERTSLPKDLHITAETAEGEIMGIRHATLPIEGIQFHPEAILTEAGHQLLDNAIQQAKRWRQENTPSPWFTRPLSLFYPPARLIQALKAMPSPFFLDSGNQYGELGRYSFLGASPFLEATAYANRLELHWPNRPEDQHQMIPLHGDSPLNILDELSARFHVNNAPFPFAGGAVGFLSYDLKDEIESLQSLALDDLHIPLWRFAWYDGIIVYDHAEGKYWITACGMNEEGQCLSSLAHSRLDALERTLQTFVPEPQDALENPNSPQPQADATSVTSTASITSLNSAFPAATAQFTPIRPSVSRDQYLTDLARVIDYIYAGDIYQANLTQRFSLPWDGDPWALYAQLHHQNPAPFAAFLPYDDFQILCSSPERFIQVFPDKTIETRPIKGTRPRGKTPEEDEAQAQELQDSLKDRAELTMIIDLERNDLGRICEFGTVRVPELIRLEKYPTVWHLVSTITGKGLPDLKPGDILKAVFPGGSITGAPKIRAMEIIEALEPHKRGIYTGSIGYMGFDGHWDFNIVIRTILLKDGKAFIHAGGGIVADSLPESEYHETLIKAKALFQVLGGHLDDVQ